MAALSYDTPSQDAINPSPYEDPASTGISVAPVDVEAILNTDVPALATSDTTSPDQPTAKTWTKGEIEEALIRAGLEPRGLSQFRVQTLKAQKRPGDLTPRDSANNSDDDSDSDSDDEEEDGEESEHAGIKDGQFGVESAEVKELEDQTKDLQLLDQEAALTSP